jgi:spore coat-associated protein N
MKKMKKALLGTALAGTLVIGAGAGTYSWFNAEYKASGEITNHTLTLNGLTEASETLDFDNKMLAPSRSVSDSFSIENTGNMDQILRAKLDLALYDGSTNVGTPDKSAYTIDATVAFTRGGNTVTETFTGVPVQVLDDYIGNNKWLPDNNGLEQAYFKKGDKLAVELKVNLLSSAGNEYQNKKLKGTLEVDARQTDAGSQFND